MENITVYDVDKSVQSSGLLKAYAEALNKLKENKEKEEQ